MNADWNTPPDGDFARYVERLSAQSASPQRAPQDTEHGLDIGMTPSEAPHGAANRAMSSTAAAAAARRDRQAQGEAPRGGSGGQAAHNLAKAMAIAWIFLLVALLTFKVPFSIVMLVLVAGLWLGRRLRRWALPPGVANWREWLAQEARRQQEKKTHSR